MSSLFARLAMRPAAKQAAAASLRRWPGIPAVASALSTCARTAATTAPAAVAWTGAASGGQHRAMSTGPSHDDDKPTLEMAKSMPDSWYVVSATATRVRVCVCVCCVCLCALVFVHVLLHCLFLLRRLGS